MHEAQEADAAQVGRRVVALEPDPLPVGPVPESRGFSRSHIDRIILQNCINVLGCVDSRDW